MKFRVCDIIAGKSVGFCDNARQGGRIRGLTYVKMFVLLLLEGPICTRACQMQQPQYDQSLRGLYLLCHRIMEKTAEANKI